MRIAQWKLLVFVPILMGLGAGVTYWVQLSKLRAEWASWVPERPTELENDTEIEALESQIKTGDQTALAALAEAYRDQGHWTAAATAFGTLTKFEPNRGEWWLSVAEMDARGGDRRLAKARLQKAREVGLPDGGLYLAAGQLSEVLGEQIEAKADYRRAVELDPGILPAWMRLITMSRAIGDDRAAREAFDAALEANPGAPLLLMDRGRRFRERGNWRQALLDFETVRDTHPELDEPWYASAQAMFELDRYDDGRALMENRLAKDPNDKTALMLLCVESVAAGNQEESDRWIKQMRTVPSISPREWATLEAIYRESFGGALPSA